MQRDWNEIEGKAPKPEETPGTVHQPLERDSWQQRVSRMMNMEFDDFPEKLAETPFELIDQLRKYIRLVKHETRSVDEVFKEYRRSHPDHREETFNRLLDEKTRLEEEVQRLLKVSKVLLEGTDTRDQEIERQRQTIVDLQDRLDRANIRG